MIGELAAGMAATCRAEPGVLGHAGSVPRVLIYGSGGPACLLLVAIMADSAPLSGKINGGFGVLVGQHAGGRVPPAAGRSAALKVASSGPLTLPTKAESSPYPATRKLGTGLANE